MDPPLQDSNGTCPGCDECPISGVIRDARKLGSKGPPRRVQCICSHKLSSRSTLVPRLYPRPLSSTQSEIALLCTTTPALCASPTNSTASPPRLPGEQLVMKAALVFAWELRRSNPCDAPCCTVLRAGVSVLWMGMGWNYYTSMEMECVYTSNPKFRMHPAMGYPATTPR